MNLSSCFVFVALLVGAFSKTISETPLTHEAEVQLTGKTTTTIADNSTTEIQDGKSLEGFESIFDEFLAPENELKGAEEGRTFGLKRLQFMLMPMIYKMGVMMTLLVVLTVISLKGLAIGVMLLVLKLSAIFGKFYASTQYHGPVHGWPQIPQMPQPVHVHVHNGGLGHHQQPSPYNGWEAASGPPGDEHYYYKG